MSMSLVPFETWAEIFRDAGVPDMTSAAIAFLHIFTDTLFPEESHDNNLEAAIRRVEEGKDCIGYHRHITVMKEVSKLQTDIDETDNPRSEVKWKSDVTTSISEEEVMRKAPWGYNPDGSVILPEWFGLKVWAMAPGQGEL